MYYAIEFRAMGCQMMAAIDLKPDSANRLLSQVPAWFADWEACLSRFRPESELSRINRQPGIRVPVSETLWQVLQSARRAEAESQGLVTPVLLDALMAAGYTTSFDRLEKEQQVTQLSSPAGFSLRDVQFLPEQRSICLPRGMHLDLGGVAKGWAAQRAMRLLAEYGPAMVDAGGDIAISGLQSNGHPWLVGIQDPRSPGKSLGMLRLGRCGVATSGRDRRRWKQAGLWKHHLIDPRSGEPANTDVLTATVIAPTTTRAEMAAKSVLIQGSQDGLAWMEKQLDLAAVLVTEEGCLLTQGPIEFLN